MHRSPGYGNGRISVAALAFFPLLTASAVLFAQGKWVCATGAAQFSIRQGHEAVVFQNKLWVLNGYYQKVNKSDIWNSSDGKDWVKIADDSSLYPMLAHHPTAADKDYIWILGGQPGC